MKRHFFSVILAIMCTTTVWSGEINRNITSTKPSVIVFVSLSMPRQSLVAILHDANKIKASVVMRGLVNNSFKDTFREIAGLVKEAGGGGVELNPLAFQKFHIESVPAFIAIAANHPCLSQTKCDRQRDYDVISGNIPLAAALKEIEEHGTAASQEAARARNRLEARGDA